VKKVFQIALGIIAAIGGFVDIGDLVFNVQAGARYGYEVLWAVPIGVVGIMLFAEMSGRVAAIHKKANFELVREKYSHGLGLATLIASLVLCVLTLAAELGGVGIALNLLFDATEQTFMLIGVLVLIAASRFLSFEHIERIFGYGGLALLVYVVAAVDADPNWHSLGNGFVPHGQAASTYWYFVVGVMAAAFMPYEIYFYSSGAREEGWTEKDLGVNRANAIIGYGLGGLLAVALLTTAAAVFHRHGVDPSQLGTVALGAQIPLGEAGLLLAIVGILFAVSGAAIDTCFSAAYNLAQFQGWKWGKKEGHSGAPQWYYTWIAVFIVGYALVATGIDPVELTEYAVVFSVITLPLTYLPILLVARNRELMGAHANGPVTNALGWFYFVVICALACAAPPLLFITNGGGG
jgi:Mn2+/Fe2+ NRAMP family transporter